MIKAQAVKFNSARNNLLAVVAFTAINIFLLAFGVDLSFLFSAFVPQILMAIIMESSIPAGLVVALLSTAVYLLCYALSKRWRAFILVALILFSIDALIMLGFVLVVGALGEFLFNIVFHAWILFYLIKGTVAWVKLMRVTPEDFTAIQQEVATDAQTEELNSALQTITPPTSDTSGNEAIETQPSNTPMENNSMYVMDDFTKSKIIASFNQIEKLYLFDNIPPQKLANAKISYASTLGDDETIIFLFDDTVRGSANEGMILTTKRLYSKNFGMSGNVAHISNINGLHVPKFGLVSSNVIVSMNAGSEIEVHITQSKSQAEAVFNVLNEIINMMKATK